MATLMFHRLGIIHETTALMALFGLMVTMMLITVTMHQVVVLASPHTMASTTQHAHAHSVIALAYANHTTSRSGPCMDCEHCVNQQ